ncbi:hypothetical protein sce1568 [Sorangium cellulosum So ce56]|uniref:DUF4157 domain-containing protein n=1 Tax=Sorangium cellulosum (strain So ce56) TaxID=448385 RepID=A9FD43_SORC5|nr:DUF4157 domain-containing protein [Sorangium cellulosum]CAN91726.1 hypothetical protein sce1568 [Sorangium cellulosum So ce56]
MFTFDRKPGPSLARSPAPKRASQRPAHAPPVNPLWFRSATSTSAEAAASSEMTGENRRHVAASSPAPASALWSRVERPASEAGVAGEASPPVAPGPRFDFARIAPLPIQRKATISSPGDPCEREADEVAEKVMRMEEPTQVGLLPTAIQRKCAECAEEDDEKPFQTKPMLSADADAAPDVGAAARVTGSGQPLTNEQRAFFEPRFAADFSRVRIHTDLSADAAARRVGAYAFTRGSDIVFRGDQYRPHTYAGRQLLAHELTHVVQQGEAPRVQRQSAGEDGGRHALSIESRAGMAGDLVQRWPGDGMTPPGDCGWAQYLGLRGSVETAKAVVGMLGACSARDNCLTLALKIAAITAEIASRIALDTTCFRGGDTGHRQQVQDKINMVNRCQQFFSTSGCSPALVTAMAVVVERAREVIAAAAMAVATVVALALIAALVAALIALVEVIAALLAAAAESAVIVEAAAALGALLRVLQGALA